MLSTRPIRASIPIILLPTQPARPPMIIQPMTPKVSSPDPCANGSSCEFSPGKAKPKRPVTITAPLMVPVILNPHPFTTSADTVAVVQRINNVASDRTRPKRNAMLRKRKPKLRRPTVRLRFRRHARRPNKSRRLPCGEGSVTVSGRAFLPGRPRRSPVWQAVSASGRRHDFRHFDVTHPMVVTARRPRPRCSGRPPRPP